MKSHSQCDEVGAATSHGHLPPDRPSIAAQVSDPSARVRDNPGIGRDQTVEAIAALYWTDPSLDAGRLYSQLVSHFAETFGSSPDIVHEIVRDAIGKAATASDCKSHIKIRPLAHALPKPQVQP